MINGDCGYSMASAMIERIGGMADFLSGMGPLIFVAWDSMTYSSFVEGD